MLSGRAATKGSRFSQICLHLARCSDSSCRAEWSNSTSRVSNPCSEQSASISRRRSPHVSSVVSFNKCENSVWFAWKRVQSSRKSLSDSSFSSLQMCPKRTVSMLFSIGPSVSNDTLIDFNSAVSVSVPMLRSSISKRALSACSYDLDVFSAALQMFSTVNRSIFSVLCPRQYDCANSDSRHALSTISPCSRIASIRVLL